MSIKQIPGVMRERIHCICRLIVRVDAFLTVDTVQTLVKSTSLEAAKFPFFHRKVKCQAGIQVCHISKVHRLYLSVYVQECSDLEQLSSNS